MSKPLPEMKTAHMWFFSCMRSNVGLSGYHVYLTEGLDGVLSLFLVILSTGLKEVVAW